MTVSFVPTVLTQRLLTIMLSTFNTNIFSKHNKYRKLSKKQSNLKWIPLMKLFLRSERPERDEKIFPF